MSSDAYDWVKDLETVDSIEWGIKKAISRGFQVSIFVEVTQQTEKGLLRMTRGLHGCEMAYHVRPPSVLISEQIHIAMESLKKEQEDISDRCNERELKEKKNANG